MLLFMQWQVPSALKPSASMILRKTFDLLLGLSTMHELGVVHRDMKPSNIGIVQGRLVGLDPGFASDDDELVEHPAVTGEQGFRLFIYSQIYLQNNVHLVAVAVVRTCIRSKT